MAYKSSTNDPPLPSGVYAIRSATADEPYMAPQNFNDDRIVITEESVPFKWLVTDVGNQKYTLQVEQTKEYAVTSKQDTIVKLANYEQVYAIISAGPEKDGKTYYQIWTQDNRCFKYNGDDKAVTAVAYDPTKEIDYLWLFDLLETPESGTGTGDEYEIYPGSFYYFRYDGITTENPVLDRFGLRDTSDDRWVRFWDGINKLNEKGDGNVLYKVLFLGRHGHATHNPAPEAVTAPDCPQRDSPLTQNGYLQACNVEAHWTTENSLAKGGIGIPQISYCSPLMRCLVTNTLSFSPQLDADGGPTINTVVYDDCREWLYNSETGYRRSKDCISEMFSKFTVDPDLPPTDTLWVESEDADAIMARARGILDRIFKVESKDKQFVSITAHAGIISAMISVMDCDPRIFNLVNGCVIPIICQYTPGDGNKLPDGYYKIRYVPEPSLFADGVQIGEPVVASNMTSFEFPSTWFVKSLEKEKRVYSIQLIRRQLHGMPKPRAYWNVSKEGNSHSRTQDDVFVILDTNKRGWRLIPTGNPGEYFIESVEAPSPYGPPQESVSLVVVKSDGRQSVTGKKKTVWKPLILKSEKDIGPNPPRWNFIPIRFPLSLCKLSVKDALNY